MKRGLVIGKFMPLHLGHCALIRFAATLCDEVIVSMSYKISDPIPGQKRLEWIIEEFANEPKVKPEISLDNFDDESLTLKERLPLWATFIKSRFPKIDAIVSSESYGIELASFLGIEHISFDPGRKKFPVSGTMIRSHPFDYWNFISVPARQYFVKKICFYGPESTGKSTMAKHFAKIFNTEFVPEVSRELITTNEFTVEDIIRIGETQTARVIEKSKSAYKLLFCDTDLITTEIYCRHYLKQVPQMLYHLENEIQYDRYFLFQTDVPWVADEIRDLGDRRQEMYNVFKQELEERNIKYDVVKGNFADREKFLVDKIQQYFFSA